MWNILNRDKHKVLISRYPLVAELCGRLAYMIDLPSDVTYFSYVDLGNRLIAKFGSTEFYSPMILMSI
jgi:hypothetical protein